MNKLIQKSIDLYNKGNLKKAKKYAEKALKADSLNPGAYVNLGNVYFLAKDFAKALECYHKADSLKEGYYFSKINLANTYSETKDYDKAVFYAKQSLNINEKSKLAYQILGQSYFEKKQFDDSITSYLNALKQDPSDPWIYNFLSLSYQKKSLYDDALKAAWEAVKLAPDDNSHHINLGYLLYEVCTENSAAKAKDYAHKWLELYDDNPIASHMANAVLNNQNITKANDRYVENIFDVFSTDFESVLHDLNYRVPDLIEDFMPKFYGPRNKNLTILDAGCGTGLCGVFLQKYSSWRGLEGVDISSKMLDIAKAKKVYNKLYHIELEHFLSGKKNKYDLIVSADVFTYIGDLQNLFKFVHKSLKKSGRIIFSIAENNHNLNGFFLTPSGRYIHTQNYIEQTLKQNNLKIEKIERHILRHEAEIPVPGYIVAAIK